jgi:hypothetical protein
LQKEINTVGGSFMIQRPANIPSNVDKYQPVFLDFPNDSLTNHSDSFVLTRETQPANVTRLSKGGLSAGDKTAIGILVPVVVTDFLHRFRSELTGKNEVQQEKDGTFTEMPNETLNEIHTDNDSPVGIPVSESRSVQLHAGGAPPPIEMPSPSPVMEKASCIKDS